MAVVDPENVGVEVNTDTSVLTVTPAATEMIKTLLEQRQIPDHVLRVFVSGGGCSGMQYGMAFEQAPGEHDQIVSSGDVRLVIDPTSLMYLEGATIDFVDSLMGGGFRIDNPNSVSSCGCGKSFKSSNDADNSADEAGCSSCSSY